MKGRTEMASIKINDDVYVFDGETLVEGVKPCPFCGNVFLKTRTRERYEELGATGFSIECQKCDTEMWYFPNLQEKLDYDIVLRGLIEKWNRRANA